MNPGNLWVHGQPPFDLRMHWDPPSRKPLWRAGHEPRGEARASADWKSAVQQSGTLRYGEEVHGQPPFDFSHALGPGTAAASWSAPVPWRYSGCAAIESARGLAHSKTWRGVDGSWKGEHPRESFCASRAGCGRREEHAPVAQDGFAG